MTSLVPSWLLAVSSSYDSDPAAKDMITKLALDLDSVVDFSLHFGILHYRNRIWIGHDTDLQQKLIAEFHASAWGGHSSVPVTYARLCQYFAWKGMKTDVKLFVQSCLVCQQSKHDQGKSPGLLQPLPVPDSAWQVISLDFIEGSSSRRYNCILVVIDPLQSMGISFHFPTPSRHLLWLRHFWSMFIATMGFPFPLSLTGIESLQAISGLSCSS